INDDGTLSVDGRLKGGFIAPGEKLTIVPANPAKYSYFCKIHPWLEGFVSVKASPDTSKAKVSADTAKPKAGKDTAKPKAGKDTAKPKAGKDTAKPKAGKDTAKPKAGKDNVTLAKAVTDNVTLPKVSADTAKSKAVTEIGRASCRERREK